MILELRMVLPHPGFHVARGMILVLSSNQQIACPWQTMSLSQLAVPCVLCYSSTMDLVLTAIDRSFPGDHL
jgi:hypothetical protein